MSRILAIIAAVLLLAIIIIASLKANELLTQTLAVKIAFGIVVTVIVIMVTIGFLAGRNRGNGIPTVGIDLTHQHVVKKEAENLN